LDSKPITSFAEFIRHTEAFDLVAHHLVFRGQPVQGNLLPGVARSNPSRNTTDVERTSLQEIRLLGASLLPSPRETALDLMVWAQHYGLKTRLLDWTTNPLAALWFACADRRPGDVFVYGLIAEGLLLDGSVYEQDPFDAAKTRVLRPRLNNPRVLAQNGWFTLHRFSRKSKRFVPLERNPETNEYLYEYKIPNERRAEILISLDRHGVSARTLLPDSDGLCTYLNWKLFNGQR
jgi:hypothetical protein